MKNVLIFMGAIVLLYFWKVKKVETPDKVAAEAEIKKINTAATAAQVSAQTSALQAAEIARLNKAAADAKAAGDAAQAINLKAAADLAAAQKNSADKAAIDAAAAEAARAKAAALQNQVLAEEAARNQAYSQANETAAAQAAAETASATTYAEAKKAFVDTTAAATGSNYADASAASQAIMVLKSSDSDPYIQQLTQKYAEVMQWTNTISEATIRWTIQSFYDTIDNYKNLYAAALDRGDTAGMRTYQKMIEGVQITADMTIAAFNTRTAGNNYVNGLNTSGFTPKVKRSSFR